MGRPGFATEDGGHSGVSGGVEIWGMTLQYGSGQRMV
jgi:hypothetical protein